MLLVFQKNSHMLSEDSLVTTYFFISQQELHINQLCITKAQNPGCLALNPTLTHSSHLTSTSSNTILF